ncbi:hypothetical protein ACFLQL_00075 [Verrucomicrobiota bacterium]
MRIIFLYIAICFLVISVSAKPIKPDNDHSTNIAVAIQKQIDNIKNDIKLKNWDAVKKNYKSIDWREKGCIVALQILSKELPKNNNLRDLRRKIKTKYSLLKANSDPELANLNDVTGFVIPITEIATIDIANVDLDPYFTKVDNELFLSTMQAWERRWSVVVDVMGVDNTRYIPSWGTALRIQRDNLMLKIGTEGWTETNEKAWIQYHRDLLAALSRKKLVRDRIKR